MKGKVENIDWLSKFCQGQIALYEAILLYMAEERVVPIQLYELFDKAIDDYKDGKTVELEIGLSSHYPKSKAKRAREARRIYNWVFLSDKLKMFTNIGLKKVKPEQVKEKHSVEIINSLKTLLLAHDKRLTFQPQELEFMTAYQAVGKIFKISEATVRKKLES